MAKKNFYILLITFLVLFSNTVGAAAYDQQFRSIYENRMALPCEEKEGLSEAKPEVEKPEEKGSMKLSSEDIDLLARLVYAEARGEPFQGKVGVAATVLNRVKNPSYPDTVSKVIYQQNHGFQYCPVRNGQIYRPADKTSYQAVREAMQGRDPTGGALSFYNPAKSCNSWIKTKNYCCRIGSHVFVK